MPACGVPQSSLGASSFTGRVFTAQMLTLFKGVPFKEGIGGTYEYVSIRSYQNSLTAEGFHIQREGLGGKCPVTTSSCRLLIVEMILASDTARSKNMWPSHEQIYLYVRGFYCER